MSYEFASGLVVRAVPPAVPEVRSTPPSSAVTVVPLIGPQGPQGPPGVAGAVGPPSSGTTYTHVQGVASAVWTITHTLERRPGGITVVDSAERVVTGDVRYLSDDQVELSFIAAFSGRAYLS